jgi:hypothetical protein
VLIATSVPAIAGRAAVKRIALAAAGVGVCATLLAPAAYALDTMGSAYGGGDPHPGPGTTAGLGGPGGLGGLGGGLGPIGGLGLITGPGAGGPVAGGLPGDGGGLGGNSSDTALLSYLVSNRGSASWIVAANSAQEAGSIELATGLPVMAMGGFTGSDPAPTLAQLQGYIASGKLRFVLASGRMGGGAGGLPGVGGTGTSDRTTWVTSTCKAVSYGGSASLYDCAGAA